jgi:hypothetical protein
MPTEGWCRVICAACGFTTTLISEEADDFKRLHEYADAVTITRVEDK